MNSHQLLTHRRGKGLGNPASTNHYHLPSTIYPLFSSYKSLTPFYQNTNPQNVIIKTSTREALAAHIFIYPVAFSDVPCNTINTICIKLLKQLIDIESRYPHHDEI